MNLKYPVLLMLCCAAVIAYVQRLALGMSEENIRDTLGLDKGQLGWIMAAWAFGYAALQLPSGWLADRWGSRPTLTLYALLWSAVMGLAAWAWDYYSLLTLWCLMGMAQAGVFPCSTKVIGRWFPEQRRATASGLLASAMALGIAVSPTLTTQLLDLGLNWRAILQWYVVPGVLWAAAFWLLVPEHPPVESDATKKPKPPPPPLDWARVFTSLPLWLLCGQQFFRAAAMMFFQTWFPTFLRETRGVSLVHSGWLTTCVGIGALLGGLMGGFFSDWLFVQTGNRRLSRQGIAVAGIGSCGLLIFASYFVADTRLAIACISLGAFLATFGGISGYTVAIEFGGRHVATTFSLMNMCGNIGAALFPPIVGQMVERGLGWDTVLFFCAGILLVDAVCWALLNPTTTLAGEPFEHGTP
jgi:predicted MFS family arabinose efflux permease